MTKTVDLETSQGTIRLELDDEKAPITVKNFITNVENGHFDGTGTWLPLVLGGVSQISGMTTERDRLEPKWTSLRNPRRDLRRREGPARRSPREHEYRR